MDEKRYIKRKEKARIDGNREQLAISCNQLGDHFNQQGKYNEAVKEYKEEASIYASMGKELETAKAKRMVGEMFMLLCEYDAAKDHINDYLKISKSLENKVEQQRAYATLGRVHLLHGQSLTETTASGAMEQLRMAEKSFLRSLLLIKELTGQISKVEQFDMQARCYLNIGVVKEHMEAFESSIEYIEKAIKISKTNDLFELSYLCYISMSLLYHYKKNDAVSALRYCNLALEVAKRLPNKVKKICEALITKSEILIKVGDFASVKQILTKAYKKHTPDENDRATIERILRVVVKICQTLDELVVTSSVDYGKLKDLYEKLGDGCCHLQNYAKALSYYQKMLENAELNAETGKSLVPIYVSLYQTYKDNKQYDKALEYLWKEFELNQDVPSEAFTTLCSIAEICEQQSQSFWTIHDIYQKALRQASKAGDSQAKLEKIAMVRLKRLELKHGMDVLAENLEAEAKAKGIDLSAEEDDEEEEDSDGGPEVAAMQHNTPDWGDDVCLDSLTDLDASDLDESEKPRPQRTTRGSRTLTIKRNNKGETQLHQACIAGNLELARRLIDQGHTVNVRDHAGWLPLHEACNHGYRDIVELLLDKGAAAAINDKGGTSCDGITPLYDACANGYLEVAELLLERGADATVKTDYGETCIQGLDKWRLTAQLIDGEQAQYAALRNSLLNTLSKVGICSEKNALPLTNANVQRKNRRSIASDNDDDDVSNDGDDDTENDELLPHGRIRSRSHNHVGNSGNNMTGGRSSPRNHSDYSENDMDKSRPSPRQESASKEYRNVMAHLKHPNRVPSSYDAAYDAPSSSTSNSKQKRNALMNEDEVDADNWLIDDLGPERKRKRYNSGTINSRPVTDTSKENVNDFPISAPGWEMELNSPLETPDSLQMLMDGATLKQRQKQARKLTLSRSSSISSNNSNASHKPKQQTTLLDSGFSRFRSESPLGSGEDSLDGNSVVSLRTVEPDSTTAAIQLLISPAKSSPIKLQATPVQATTISFKIKVEDELLLVPVERKKLPDINMRWLAEETSRRYYKLRGIFPMLRLKTSDGFAYEDSDFVTVALEQNVIMATVLEWKISPLTQRYEEFCHQLKTPLNDKIKRILEEAAQNEQSLVLTSQWLRAPQMEPLFRALYRQSCLTELDLSLNFIRDEGCKELAKTLPTMQKLKILRLKCNGITNLGLEALLCCKGIEKLEHLEELCLSQNLLGNSCLPTLHKFCAGASASGRPLRMLELSQCEITDLGDYDLGYTELSSFDISFNQLTLESVRMLSERLNSCRLKHLNLSYVRWPLDEQSGFALGEHIVKLLENGTCEKFYRLDLNGCGLNDAHFYKIAQHLIKAKELQWLDISDNEKLGGVTFGYILDELPQIRDLLAVNCKSLLDDVRLLKLEQQKQLPKHLELSVDEQVLRLPGPVETLRSIWETQWGEKAKILAHKTLVKMYIDEVDLKRS
ncbi:tonsoku-like protein [Scaptodrosophila lebanonensis]|uniref:Tonsoku-like protein n=1 Tax=Drosophila lebanonensis TaxID=7225 RepID=A0A6J2T9R0_DROLE|nr:tonsoku-like protein [Scaptodrosophila lebanonensis]